MSNRLLAGATKRLGRYSDILFEAVCIPRFGTGGRLLRPLFKNHVRKAAVGLIALYGVIAILGPHLPIADPFATFQAPSGRYDIQEPNLAYPLGTTNRGESIAAQVIHSFRTSMLISVSAAAVIISVGLNIGLIAGYYGGKVDSLLMGATDVAYGLPIYPLALVVVALLGQSNLMVILVIGLVLWRTLARVVRSETLSLRERGFVKASKAAGSSDVKIMYYHILPNLLPIIVVYFVFGVIWGVVLEAGLAFLGLGDPNTISWGQMLREAFNAGVFARAWWWVVPPALSLWLFILSLFVVARSLEENIEIDRIQNR